MAKITRIKASDGPRKAEEVEAPVTRKKVVEAKDPKKDKQKALEKHKADKAAAREEHKKEREAENNGKKPFILVRPFVYFGRYLRDSWREIRQVRWPSRKDTWKMVLAVFAYTAIFVLFIVLLDMFFTWLFSLIIK